MSEYAYTTVTGKIKPLLGKIRTVGVPSKLNDAWMKMPAGIAEKTAYLNDAVFYEIQMLRYTHSKRRTTTITMVGERITSSSHGQIHRTPNSDPLRGKQGS